ncbi:hypothetical protein AVEN_149384-1 [Araneus ventricosus]|uniref:Uncharacterized protein n=1 Tax=Araneus ventricosus TaxID=182803 RepID=A0A4Y2MG21_ARAVE|nr:hypothetical protein AVEN_149384-1 [Araneus ventricosus]
MSENDPLSEVKVQPFTDLPFPLIPENDSDVETGKKRKVPNAGKKKRNNSQIQDPNLSPEKKIPPMSTLFSHKKPSLDTVTQDIYDPSLAILDKPSSSSQVHDIITKLQSTNKIGAAVLPEFAKVNKQPIKNDEFKAVGDTEILQAQKTIEQTTNLVAPLDDIFINELQSETLGAQNNIQQVINQVAPLGGIFINEPQSGTLGIQNNIENVINQVAQDKIAVQNEPMDTDARQGLKRKNSDIALQNPIPPKVQISEVMDDYNSIPLENLPNDKTRIYARIRNLMRHPQRIRSYVDIHLGIKPKTAKMQEIEVKNTYIDELYPDIPEPVPAGQKAQADKLKQEKQAAIDRLWKTMLLTKTVAA